MPAHVKGLGDWLWAHLVPQELGERGVQFFSGWNEAFLEGVALFLAAGNPPL